MEAKLRDYRQSKSESLSREEPRFAGNWVSESISSLSSKISGYFNNTGNDGSSSRSSIDLSYRSERLSQSSTRRVQESSVTNQEGDTSASYYNNKAYFIVKLLLWLFSWGAFVQLGFGAVYIVISALVFVYFSTRKTPRQDGELSAYSVFNPNFERLEGTLTAEQFEKELRFGPGSVH